MGEHNGYGNGKKSPLDDGTWVFALEGSAAYIGRLANFDGTPLTDVEAQSVALNIRTNMLSRGRVLATFDKLFIATSTQAALAAGGGQVANLEIKAFQSMQVRLGMPDLFPMRLDVPVTLLSEMSETNRAAWTKALVEADLRAAQARSGLVFAGQRP